jgi:putative ABC transport system ATP-binding protein
MELIKVINLKKRYLFGEMTVEALKDINITISKGEFAAIVGASGSGKSTLLNLIGCIDNFDAGKIIIEGVDVASLSEEELNSFRNRKLGYIFQNFNLISVLSVYENVELPLLIRKDVNDEERKRLVLKALDDVALKDFLHYFPDKLSGGQRQRVAIARALSANPSLVLADEPTANLDSHTAHMIIDLLKELNQKNGVTFLFCTHDEKLIGRVDRVLKIQDGVVIS